MKCVSLQRSLHLPFGIGGDRMIKEIILPCVCGPSDFLAGGYRILRVQGHWIFKFSQADDWYFITLPLGLEFWLNSYFPRGGSVFKFYSHSFIAYWWKSCGEHVLRGWVSGVVDTRELCRRYLALLFGARWDHSQSNLLCLLGTYADLLEW